MSFDVQEYYSKLNGGDVILAFKGSITTDVINNVLEEIEFTRDVLAKNRLIKSMKGLEPE